MDEKRLPLPVRGDEIVSRDRSVSLRNAIVPPSDYNAQSWNTSNDERPQVLALPDGPSRDPPFEHASGYVCRRDNPRAKTRSPPSDPHAAERGGSELQTSARRLCDLDAR